MKPKTPKLPSELSLPEGKPSLSLLSLDHLNDIAELSKEYLAPEALEFSEETLTANLSALWHLSRQENTKVSAKHAKKIQKIVLSAFGLGSRNIRRSQHSEGGGAIRQENKKFSAAHTSSHQGSEGIIVSQQSNEVVREKAKDEERKEKKNILKKTGEYAKRQWYLAKAKHWEKEAKLYEDALYPQNAANCYEKAGKLEKAIEMYEKAARGDHDGNALKAAQLCEKLNIPARAGQNYEKAGRDFRSKAIEQYEKAHEFEKAGDKAFEFVNCNMYTRHFSDEEWLEMQPYLRRMEKNYLAARLPDKIGDRYFQLGLRNDFGFKKRNVDCYGEAFRLYAVSANKGKIEEIMRFFQSNGKSFKSDELANTYFAKANDFASNKNHADAGLYYKVATFLTAVYSSSWPLYAESGKSYEKAGMYVEAADAYNSAAQGAYSVFSSEDWRVCLEKAFNLYDLVDMPVRAAKTYLDFATQKPNDKYATDLSASVSGLLEKYKMRFISDGQFSDAAEMYKKVGDLSHIFMAQYYAEAGALYEKAQMPDKAANLYVHILTVLRGDASSVSSFSPPLNSPAAAGAVLNIAKSGIHRFDNTATNLVAGIVCRPESLDDFLGVSGWLVENYNKEAECEQTQFFFSNYSVNSSLSTAKEVINARFHPAVSLALMNMDAQWSASEVRKLRELLPPGGEVSKNKFTRPIFLSFINSNPSSQAEIIRACISRTEKFSKGDDERLLQIMSFAHSAGKIFSGSFTDSFVSSEFKSMPEAVKEGHAAVIDALSSNYSSELIGKSSSDTLARWLSVFPEFEQTMKIHHDEDLIPSMRVLATVELLGMRDGFAKHDPKVAEYLQTKLEKLFPNKEERQAIREYLDSYASMEDEKLIFATDNLSKVREKLAIWSSPTKVDHVLSEVSIRDRLLEAQQKLDDIFYKNHFSEEFIRVAGLHEDAPTMKALSEQFRKLKDSGAAESELGAIRQQQDGIRKWSKLQSIFQNYPEKFDQLNADIENAGKKLAPHADILEKWGFDYGDSFGNKVFTGELKLLSERCKSELAKNPKDERIAALSSEIADLEKACGNANSYVADLADRLKPADGKKSGILDDLQAKKAWSEQLISELEGGLSVKEGLGRIHDGQEPLYNIISARANIDKAELIDILRRYTETTAINDLEHIVSMARNESSTQNIVYTYSAQQDFSRMELAMVGQCLDYRYSKNSIGNAPFTVSYQDSWRQMVVAYQKEDSGQLRPKVDGLIFLAQVESGGINETAVVTDRIYVPDGSELGWSKVEGHIRFALEKAKELGVPLVVPDHLSPHYPQIKELAQEFGVKAEERSIKVLVQPGPSKATYCELTGYVHYAQNTELGVNALVLK